MFTTIPSSCLLDERIYRVIDYQPPHFASFLYEQFGAIRTFHQCNAVKAVKTIDRQSTYRRLRHWQTSSVQFSSQTPELTEHYSVRNTPRERECREGDEKPSAWAGRDDYRLYVDHRTCVCLIYDTMRI